MSRVLAILALILGTCSSFAQKYEIIDEYRYRLQNDEAILTSNSTWKYTGDIVVPSKVKASDGKLYKVTEIDDRCFQNCKTVTSVTLPSTISKIGQYCFADCEQMKSVNIPSAVKTISQYTFAFCTSLEAIAIPSSVTSIEGCIFKNCSNLKDVSLPSTLSTITNESFSGCSSLERIVIPSSITNLSNEAFKGCTKLSHIEFPSSITSIGVCCFQNCVSLTSLEFPSSFTIFGSRCFENCTNLESLVIPASVENLGQGSFYYCDNIKTVRFLGKVPKINESGLVKTASLYVPKDYLQDYKKAIGNKYPKIYAWTGDAEHPLCEVPSIAYSDGNLLFACNTPGAQVHYSVSSADIVTDALADDGQVSLVAAYDISAYATAEHYEKSDSEYATIYWLPTNDGSSTGIKQTETRGILVSSHGNVISVNGLDEGETISLYTIDGKLIGNAKASGGMASCTVTEPIVVVKIGELSIKITIR